MKRHIACFFDHKEALHEVDLIKTAGVDVEVATDSDTDKHDEVRVHCLVVDSIDETKAHDFLDSRMKDGGGVSLVRCPSCGSFHTEYPSRPRSSPSAAFVAGVIDKIGEMANMSAKNFGCHNCGLSFPPDHAVTGQKTGVRSS